MILPKHLFCATSKIPLTSMGSKQYVPKINIRFKGLTNTHGARELVLFGTRIVGIHSLLPEPLQKTLVLDLIPELHEETVF